MATDKLMKSCASQWGQGHGTYAQGLTRSNPASMPGSSATSKWIPGGRSPRDAAHYTAETLRKLANAIEAGAFDTGFVPFGVNGENVGELYLDFHGRRRQASK